jgi:2-haloalkanoic acid dehalogenase type II
VSAPALLGTRAVFLDFYGTLVDLNDEVRSAGFDALVSMLGVPMGPGELFRRYAELISREDDPSDDDSGFVAYRDSWVVAGDRLLGPHGIPDPGPQFAETYTELHANAGAFPEVASAVEVLSHRFRLAVVANADHDFLANCLHRNGFDFDVVVDSQTMRCYKPEPLIFREACRRLSVEPAASVMVADTPATDIAGAQRLGMRAVWINRGAATWPHGLERPDAVITNLGELADLLR